MQNIDTIIGSCPTFWSLMRSLMSTTPNLLSCVALVSRRR